MIHRVEHEPQFSLKTQPGFYYLGLGKILNLHSNTDVFMPSDAGGLSGHGFKFAPALGVGLVEAAETGRIPEHLACFGLSRFDNSSVTGRTHLSDGNILTGANWRI